MNSSVTVFKFMGKFPMNAKTKKQQKKTFKDLNF